MSASAQAEVRFTAKRACIWDGALGRWKTISRETAQTMIALGTAVELKDGEWF